MNNDIPETAAAACRRTADLEQQLRLSDEGVSRLAQRCLELEQQGWKVIVVWECQLKKNVIHDTLMSLVDEIRRGGQL